MVKTIGTTHFLNIVETNERRSADDKFHCCGDRSLPHYLQRLQAVKMIQILKFWWVRQL